MSYITDYIATIISLILAPIATWFFITKPYQKKDLESKDIDNDANKVSIISQNLDIYQRMLDDVEQRAEAKFEKLYKEIDDLEKENDKLRDRVKILEKKLDEAK